MASRCDPAALFGVAGFSLGFPTVDPILGLAVGGLVFKTTMDCRQLSVDVHLVKEVLTSTFLLTMSEHPVEREIVTQVGIPSGIAATARVTAVRIM